MASYTLATKDGLATTQYTSSVRNQIAKRTLTGLLSYSINFRDVNPNTTYWYKIRGVREINGELIYTPYTKISVKTKR